MLILLFIFLSSCKTTPKPVDQSKLDDARWELRYSMLMDDYEKALPKAKQLAEFGYKDAQLILAALLLKDIKTDQELIEGMAWLNVACESQTKECLDLREDLLGLIKDMNKQEIEERTAELRMLYGIKVKKTVIN